MADIRNAAPAPAVPLGVGPVDRPLLAGPGAPDYDNVLACIRCGLCLAVCPTYSVERVEVQSPRGRVALIRAVDEGRLPLGSPGFRAHLYHCLDCRACQSICPSGVKVGELVLAARAGVEASQRPSLLERAIRWLALRLVLTSAERLWLFARLLPLYQAVGLQRVIRRSGVLHRLPGGWKVLGVMEDLLPRLSRRPLHAGLPEVVPARGERRYRVGFFLGCMMSVVLAETSRATVRVLAENGCEVVTPPHQRCCGAPHAEEGDAGSQRRFARHNVDLFSRYGLDCIVTDCAACGAETKKYGHLLADEPKHAEKAAAFSAKVRDVSEFLAGIPLRQPEGSLPARVTYHEPCHLCHAQGIRKPPREVLKAIPGVQLVELRESDWCCGSAGVYNITHAERAEKLLQRKVRNLKATQADVVATGNPGCLLQLQAGVRRAGLKTRVAHPIELLDEAYRGRLQPGAR